MTISPLPQPRSYTTSSGPTFAVSSMARMTWGALGTHTTSRAGAGASTTGWAGAQPPASASATSQARSSERDGPGARIGVGAGIIPHHHSSPGSVQMSSIDPVWSGVAELSRAFVDRMLSPVDVVDALL